MNIQAQADQDLARRCMPGTFIYLLTFGIVWGFSHTLGSYYQYMLVIAAVLILSTIIRALCVFRFNSIYQNNPQYWRAMLGLSALLQAAAWGVLSMASMVLNVWSWDTMIIFLSGAAFAAGAVTTLTVNLRLINIYLLLIMLPTILATIYIATPESFAFTVVASLYFIFLWQLAARLNTDYWTALSNANLLEQKANDLQAINAELESFAYSVSHDLRGPLRSIDGFSQALMEDAKAKLNEDEQTSLMRIRRSSQRMGMLIDDLLNLSRVSRSAIHSEPLSLSEIATQSIEKLQQSDPQRKMDVEIEPDLKVMADKTLIDVVIDNLLSNAWKYTSKTNNPMIKMGAKHEAGKVVFYVKDNGVGFDMRYAHKLFGPFQRLHGQEQFPGTGIGLATVKRIIHRHGGEIWAEAMPDEGATFYFTLGVNIPYAKVRSRKKPAPAELVD